MTPDTSITDLMSTGEVANVLGCSRQHVVDMCRRGELPHIQVGTHRRVRRADLDALTRSHLSRDQERSLWLHHAVAGQLTMNPDGVLSKARQNVQTLRVAHPLGVVRRQIDQWQSILDGPLDAVLEVLTSRAEYAVELRQNSPFAGVLPEENRQTVLAAFRSYWRLEHVA